MSDPTRPSGQWVLCPGPLPSSSTRAPASGTPSVAHGSRLTRFWCQSQERSTAGGSDSPCCLARAMVKGMPVQGVGADGIVWHDVIRPIYLRSLADRPSPSVRHCFQAHGPGGPRIPRAGDRYVHFEERPEAAGPGREPDGRLTIDTEVHPAKILLIRGRAELTSSTASPTSTSRRTAPTT